MHCLSGQAILRLRLDIWAIMAIWKCVRPLRRDSGGFANRAKRRAFLRQSKRMRGIGYRKAVLYSRLEAMSVCWRDRAKSWRRSSGSDRAFRLFPQRTNDEPKGKLANSDHNCGEHKCRSVRVGFSDQKARQLRGNDSCDVADEVEDPNP